VRVPRNFSPRNAKHKRDLASSLRSALAQPTGPPRPERVRPRPTHDPSSDASLADLRRRLRSHPCHGCSEREDHARWAERHHRLEREHDALVRRIEGRTSSIARVFDRVCDVLLATGYLEEVPAASGGTRTRVTDAGTTLRRLYAESDLLVAECLREGAWDGLDAPSLAAVVSTVVYEARREELDRTPPIPGGPHGRLGQAIDRTVRHWSRLEDLEESHRLQTTRAVDTGLVEPIHRWASGRGLGTVLEGTDMAAGDFVRWCKQVIDLLDQVAQAAPAAATRTAARKGVEQLRRGVVAWTPV